MAAISCTVLSPRSASSATVALNLFEKFRRFVILVSIRSCWIHLSSLSSFAGPLQAPATQSTQRSRPTKAANQPKTKLACNPMVAGALRANFSDVADALTITAYSSTILGAAVCGIGILRTNLFPKWLSGLFTAVASLAFILMAIGEPADFGNSAFIIHCKTCFTVFMSFHLLLAVLGVFVIRSND